MPDSLHVDVHQHVWTDPLLAALARRERHPFVREERGLTVLHTATEPAYVIDRVGEHASARRALLDRDGVDLAVVAISSPIGIEGLPRAEAAPLIEAFLDGVEGLGQPGFAAWGPIALEDPDPNDVDAVLDRGARGVSLPAHAITGSRELASIAPVLGRLAERGRPLFIHPGPATDATDAPLWWPALTDYVAQMQAAWLSFVTAGRPEHPELTVLFAMLAGGAPLLSERLATRGGPHVDLCDGHTLYDTSSYGPGAVTAMAERVGRDHLVYGSDRPVVTPMPTAIDALLQRNGATLLDPARARRAAVSA